MFDWFIFALSCYWIYGGLNNWIYWLLLLQLKIMSSYIDFVSAGEKFGFTGSELKDWADKQFADYKRNKIEEEERIERKKDWRRRKVR